MSVATSVCCQDCGRVNKATARRCLWCGTPIIERACEFEPIRVDMDYVKGLERMPDPTAVRLVLDACGIAVSESMPGSRTVRISADAVIDARASYASAIAKSDHACAARWRRLLPNRFALAAASRKLSRERKHFCRLTISYKDESKIRGAVFSREDDFGISSVEKFAQAIRALVKLRAKQAQSETDAR